MWEPQAQGRTLSEFVFQRAFRSPSASGAAPLVLSLRIRRHPEWAPGWQGRCLQRGALARAPHPVTATGPARRAPGPSVRREDAVGPSGGGRQVGGPRVGAGPGRCWPRSVLRPQEGDAIASAFRQHLKLHCLHVTIAWCGRSDDDARAGNQDEPPGTRRRGPVLSKHMLDPEGRERTGALSPRPPAGLGVRRPRRPRPGSPCGPLCCSRDRRAGALSSCASGSHLGKGSDRNRSAADESSTSASGFLQSKLWRIRFR